MAEGFIQGFKMVQDAANPVLQSILQANTLKNRLRLEKQMRDEMNLDTAQKLEGVINEGRGGVTQENIPSFQTPHGIKSPAFRDPNTGAAIDPNVASEKLQEEEVQNLGVNPATGRNMMGSPEAITRAGTVPFKNADGQLEFISREEAEKRANLLKGYASDKDYQGNVVGLGTLQAANSLQGTVGGLDNSFAAEPGGVVKIAGESAGPDGAQVVNEMVPFVPKTVEQPKAYSTDEIVGMIQSGTLDNYLKPNQSKQEAQAVYDTLRALNVPEEEARQAMIGKVAGTGYLNNQLRQSLIPYQIQNLQSQVTNRQQGTEIKKENLGLRKQQIDNTKEYQQKMIELRSRGYSIQEAHNIATEQIARERNSISAAPTYSTTEDEYGDTKTTVKTKGAPASVSGKVVTPSKSKSNKDAYLKEIRSL